MPSRAISKKAYFDKIGYQPFNEQKLYHASKSRFRVPVCGRRFGKSLMAGRDLEPDLFLPDKRYWIVGPTYDLGEKEFRVIWDDLIVRQGLGKDKRIKKAYNKRSGEMYIEFPWRTILSVRSADRPDSLVGDSLDRVIMSEAAKHKLSTWERYIRPALADKAGSADFPTTPEGHNWLYDLWMLGKDANVSEYESWRFPSWLNSVIFPGGESDPEIELLRKTMSDEWFMQEIGADFASFVGKIYSEFDEAYHVENVEYDPSLPNYMAFDWGFARPLACVEFQVTPRDEIRVWREHYRSNLTLEEHAAIINGREQPEGYKIDMAFGDAADPAAVMYISQHIASCNADSAAKENWREGVDLVKYFLKLRHDGVTYDDFERPVEEPKYKVDFSCVEHIREMNNYRTRENLQAGKEHTAQGVAQTIDDHTLDAMRYALMHLYKLGAQHHLSEVDKKVAASGQLPPGAMSDIVMDNAGGNTYFNYRGSTSVTMTESF